MRLDVGVWALKKPPNALESGESCVWGDLALRSSQEPKASQNLVGPGWGGSNPCAFLALLKLSWTPQMTPTHAEDQFGPES